MSDSPYEPTNLRDLQQRLASKASATAMGGDELARLRADLARVTDQCNRQEHGFARRESALQGELVAARAETARLRERVEKVVAWIRTMGDPTGISGDYGLVHATTAADKLDEALTSDPEPTT